jgi:hypothetical protein
MGEEGDKRAARVAAAHHEVADRVTLDLAAVADCVTHDVERQVLVSRRPVRAQQSVEEFRDGHRAGSLWR